MKKKIRLLTILLLGLLLIGCDNKKDVKLDKQEETKIEEKDKTSESKKEIFYGVYYFGLGSRRVKIYDNGDVYEDVEIENPNHQVDYKFLKTLTNEELDRVNEAISNSSGEELSKHIIKIVYGVEEFGNMGEY